MIKGVIREAYKSSKISLAESQQGVPEGMMRVTGVAAIIGIKNRNNRIYTEDNYVYWINKLQPLIKAGKLFGELEHPDSDNIDNNNVSHKIEALWYNPKDKTVYITLLLLDTPKGKIAQSIIRAGGTISVSSRANGSVTQQGYAVIDDLITYDIVGTPGFAESELSLSENCVKLASNKMYETIMFATAEQCSKNAMSLCEALNTANNDTYSNLFNNMKKNQKIREQNVARAKKALQERRASKNTGNLTEGMAAQIENWIFETYTPTLLGYMSKAGMIRINESAGNLKSFGDFARGLLKLREEATAELGTEVLDKVESPLEEEEEEKVNEEGDDKEKLTESINRKLNRKKAQLKEARKKLREAEEGDVKDEVEDLKDEIKDLKKDVEELEDKLDEAVQDANPMAEEEEPVIEDCELTEEDINNLSDDELENYIQANENQASDDTELNEDPASPFDECGTPGAAEELAECGGAEDPTMPENEEETPAEETPAEENPAEENIEEEVESPFLTEARKKLRNSARLAENIRRRYGTKKK